MNDYMGFHILWTFVSLIVYNNSWASHINNVVTLHNSMVSNSATIDGVVNFGEYVFFQILILIILTFIVIKIRNRMCTYVFCIHKYMHIYILTHIGGRKAVRYWKKIFVLLIYIPYLTSINSNCSFASYGQYYFIDLICNKYYTKITWTRYDWITFFIIHYWIRIN